MTKLTLSINPEVVSRAKRYAEQRGLSVSKIVESYLAAISHPPEASADTPVLRALRGTLKRADLNNYREHLASRYR